MPKKTFQIEKNSSSLRIDQYLAKQDGLPSRSKLKNLFKENKILLNGNGTKPSVVLKDGDKVEIDVPPPIISKLKPENIKLDVIYEDEDLIIINKPAGLLTHPTTNTTEGTLVNALLYHCKDLSGIGGEIKPGIVHRLDKLTSGVMVAAKNDNAHIKLSDQFREHSIDRRYLSIVYGEMRFLSGRFETLIGRDEKHRLRMTTKVRKGRTAITNYKVITRTNGFSLVECKLETGRTHQIRVHMSENSHPIVGDQVYGRGRAIPNSLAPDQRAAIQKLKRQALHAYRLGFLHPSTQKELLFESGLPPDIKIAAECLGLLKPEKNK